jgi:hydroxyacylglutathione hydrolase
VHAIVNHNSSVRAAVAKCGRNPITQRKHVMSDRLQYRQFPCLSDNFGVLVHDPETGATASIDAPEAGPILEALADTGWTLSHILVTHHHGDHTDGIKALREHADCQVIGPAGEADKIDGLDVTVAHDDRFSFGSVEVRVIETPGHTLGEISYWIPEAQVAFTGDTLFALGCGRVFEGTPNMMWSSLERLRQLPGETVIYCGHEYSQANARFAVTVDPDNMALRERAKEIENLRAQNLPTLPTRMDIELATNPFLRPDDPAVQAAVGLAGADTATVFTEIRTRKDNF